MKEGWKYKTLGECGTFTRGGNFLKSDFIEDGIPCVHYGQIHTKFGIAIESHISSIPADKAKKMASKGDLLIAITSEDVEGSCKCTAWLGDYDVAMGGHSAIYKHSFEPKYISYYFRSSAFYKEKEKYAHGFKVVEIKPSDIAKIPVPVPPLPEQQRIVTFLDTEFAKIDALKAKAEQSLQNAKDLFQAALKEEMTPKEDYITDKLINVFNFIDYRGATPTKITSGVPLITAKNVKKGYIDYTVKDYISEHEFSQRQSRGVSHKGDILFTTEAPLGNVALADLDVFSAGQRLITFQQYESPKYEVENKYFMYYFLASDFQSILNKLATGATAQGIKAKILKEVKIIIPSIDEQRSTVVRLDTLSALVFSLEQKYAKIASECDALKQALLRETFE